jgi:hypothetical protein
MMAIPLTPLTLDVARRIIWFEPPERALADPIRFMAYAMTYARHEDMRVIRRYVTDDDMREALDNAPPGIIDPRSWAYWNSKMGRYPVPPLPVRKFVVSGDSKNQMLPRPYQDFGSKPPALDLEGQRRVAREAWQRMRDQQPTKHDIEEVRRLARENWRRKYGDGK